MCPKDDTNCKRKGEIEKLLNINDTWVAKNIISDNSVRTKKGAVEEKTIRNAANKVRNERKLYLVNLKDIEKLTKK